MNLFLKCPELEEDFFLGKERKGQREGESEEGHGKEKKNRGCTHVGEV